MKWHKRISQLLADCEDSDSWDIGENEELRLAWREEVESNFCQIYKDLLKMEAALDVAARQYESLNDVTDLYAERLRRAQE